MATDPKYYPEARVIIKGIVKAPELNGKVGIVRSPLGTNGRHHVELEGGKSYNLKPSNLEYEERTAESLSIKELKAVLSHKNVDDSLIRGSDKSELLLLLETDSTISSNNLAEILAEINASKRSIQQQTTSSSTMPSRSTMADALSNMSPDELKRQAQAMRSMPPDQIRRMNPQLANMNDAQILQAASQMEMMASNPAMMKMAADQMKNMDPEELRRLQAQLAPGGRGAPVASTTSASAGNAPNSSMPPAANEAEMAAAAMENMTPEQIKQQAQAMRTMPPDQIRKMNPALANMNDAQISQAASQMEMMANNPAMMKMAMEQMKNMKPEDIERMKQQAATTMGATGGTTANASSSPSLSSPTLESSMMENMDARQLKQMLKMVKENPEMLKQVAQMTGMPEASLAQGMEQFAGMDDAKMEMAVKVMAKAQKAKQGWEKINAKVGGHLSKILIIAGLLAVGAIVWRLWFATATAGGGPAVLIEPEENTAEIPVPIMNAEDEFANTNNEEF